MNCQKCGGTGKSAIKRGRFAGQILPCELCNHTGYHATYSVLRRRGKSLRNERDALDAYAKQLEICLAWEAGELSEGRAAKLLGLDRVSARQVKGDAIARGLGYEDFDEWQAAHRKESG